MVLEKPGFCGWSIEYSRTLLMKNPETGFLWVEYRIFSYFVDEKPRNRVFVGGVSNILVLC